MVVVVVVVIVVGGGLDSIRLDWIGLDWKAMFKYRKLRMQASNAVVKR